LEFYSKKAGVTTIYSPAITNLLNSMATGELRERVLRSGPNGRKTPFPSNRPQKKNYVGRAKATPVVIPSYQGRKRGRDGLTEKKRSRNTQRRSGKRDAIEDLKSSSTKYEIFPDEGDAGAAKRVKRRRQ
jgi:hypothetical protein